MDIYVNETKIEFQLEQEKTVGDVLASLSHWGQNRHYIFTGYSLNGGSFQHGLPKEGRIFPTLDDIQSIAVTFQPTFDYAYEIVEDLQFQVNHIYRQLVLEQEINDVVTVVPWMREALRKLIDIYHWEDSRCMEAITTLGVFLEKRHNGTLDEKGKSTLISTCLSCVRHIDRCNFCGYIYYLEEIMSIGEFPADFLEKILVLIDLLRCELFNIGENIAVGNDKDAMLDLQNFMHGCSALVTYVQHLKGVDSAPPLLHLFEESIKSMTEILLRVEVALQELDLVCVADSLEYEIYEHIQVLLEKVGEVVTKECV